MPRQILTPIIIACAALVVVLLASPVRSAPIVTGAFFTPNIVNAGQGTTLVVTHVDPSPIPTSALLTFSTTNGAVVVPPSPVTIVGNGSVSVPVVTFPVPDFSGQVVITVQSNTGTGAADTLVVRPSNNDCAHAIELTEGSHLFSTVLATTDGAPTCRPRDNTWYSYTATCTDTLAVTVDSANYSTFLSVYDGSSCASVPLACDSSGGSSAAVQIDATAGQSYLISIGGITTTGSGTLTVRQAPGNDDCDSALAVVDGMYIYDTTCATDGSETCDGNNNQVWFRYTAPCDAFVTIDTIGSSYDTWLSVSEGACGGATCIAQSDDAVGVQSRVTIEVSADQQLLIAAGGFSSRVGAGVLNIETRPVNDLCIDAVQVIDGTYAYDTRCAVEENTAPCGSGRSVWFAYNVGACDGTLVADTFGSVYDTFLSVYELGDCADLALIQCNDDFFDVQSRVSIDVAAGQQLLIAVGGASADAGRGFLTVEFSVPNDECADAAVVTDGSHQFSTTCATHDDLGCDGNNNQVWFRYIAPCTGPIDIDTQGSSYDTWMSLREGFGCSEFATCLAQNDDAIGVQSRIVYDATEGQELLIAVGGFSNRRGDGVLNIRSGQPNDQCDQATPIGIGTHAYDTVCATYDGAGGCPSNADLWFAFDATASGSLGVTAIGLDYDPRLAIFGESDCQDLAGSLIACEDDTFGLGDNATVETSVTAGQTVLIAVGGSGALETGSGQLILDFQECLCDPDRSGTVDITDLLSFLDAWFVTDPAAECDGAPGIVVTDLLCFLACWLPAASGEPCS